MWVINTLLIDLKGVVGYATCGRNVGDMTGVEPNEWVVSFTAREFSPVFQVD